MTKNKTMPKNQEIYLNSSEHIFDLSFSDNLMLSKYARSNNFMLCSMIGGAESLRDLQESKNLFSEAYEFPMIESIFAIHKIFNALEKVFKKDKDTLIKKKIFINISSKMGLDLINDLNNLEIPRYINKSNLTFLFERRSIIKSFGFVKDNNFDLINFEEKANNLISSKLNFLESLGFSHGISGGITNESISKLHHFNLKPNFIKTGIFTLKSKEFNNQFFKLIFNLQNLEQKLICLMNKTILQKHHYLEIRERHLKNYLDTFIS